MAADFKKYVTDLRAEKSKPWKFPDRSKLEGVERSDENCGRLIAHVDMVRIGLKRIAKGQS